MSYNTVMEKILNLLKRPTVATFWVVLSSALLLFAYSFDLSMWESARQNIWKFLIVAFLCLTGLRMAVRKKSYPLLYWACLLIFLAALSHGFVLLNPDQWNGLVVMTLAFAGILSLPLGLVSAILVRVLTRLSRANKSSYYFKVGLTGLGLGVLALLSTIVTYSIVSLLGCLLDKNCAGL